MFKGHERSLLLNLLHLLFQEGLVVYMSNVGMEKILDAFQNIGQAVGGTALLVRDVKNRCVLKIDRVTAVSFENHIN